MPQDHSNDLDLAYFQHWLTEVCIQTPVVRETWACYFADCLGMYLMGGEL